MTARACVERAQAWWDETRLFARQSRSPSDFARLMRTRLSRSKLGPIVTRRPTDFKVDLRNLGGEVVLRSHTTDICVVFELATGCYAHLPEDAEVRTVVDLGANTGLAARWLRQRYQPDRLVCVEPEAANAEMLRANVRDATVVEACIGGYERQVALETLSGEYGYRMCVPPARQTLSVPVVTMDRLLAGASLSEGPLDLVKCDIEGAEAELFEDCRSWIGRVESLVVECHAPYTAAALEGDLIRNGGRFEVLHLERDDRFGTETVTLRAVYGARSSAPASHAEP